MRDPTQLLILQAIREVALTSEWRFVKSAKVLATAIDRAGLLTPARNLAIRTEYPPPPRDEVIDQFYGALVALVHEPDPTMRLVEGNGNFGDPAEGDPPANPLFNECLLTDLGRAVVAS